ncbi:MAG TPA: IS110 family transposase [Burkholderiales bacterium]|nr:IS110 family transposase [Burkholderiales bacterium]
MEVLYPRCAGLDVHQASVVACIRIAAGARASREVRTFETTTRGLLALVDWLREAGCTHVAMESTGVYWKPVWHVLEGEFELLLANATHIRNVPGRKTDVNDATWIADLLAHGLIKSSFVPPTAVQELRDLTRTRKQLVRELARHVQRIQKTLEDANIKIAGVISDILGVSGRAFLDAIIAGETDPQQLAALTRSRLRASREQIVEALRGQVREHHRFMLKLHLQQVKSLENAISEIEARLGECLEPFREEVKLLTTMPGISQTAAHVMAAEMGVDMQRFSGADSLVSWAGMCPRSDESAGKRRSTRLRKGAPWLKTTLIQAAWAASRTKKTYLHALFHRLKARRGAMKAIVAVAASMLRSAYHMLTRRATYEDLGPDHFDRRTRTRTVNRLLRRLKDLGVEVIQTRIQENVT